jgi:hypothetical protein
MRTIDLARNRAITDAVVLSGDEDIRIGVQIAQSFGVRVHLLGIVPSRGSQSIQLLQESDTTTEWDRATVNKFLSIKAPVTATFGTAVGATVAPAVQTAAAVANATASTSGPTNSLLPLQPPTAGQLDKVAADLFSTLDSADVTALHTYLESQHGIPREFDGKLLARGRDAVGRDLDSQEKKYIRAKFRGLG